jgi:hypothetical protein
VENCVEFAALPDGNIAMRNSKHPMSEAVFSQAAVEAFLRGAKAGEFDELA